MDWIDFIIWFPVGLWLISFSYNSYYFFKHDDTLLDSVFINLSKTFEEAHEKLTILEKEMGATLKTARNRLRFYEKNARLTRRKYRYYVAYIEPSLMKIFVGKSKSNYKRCWKLLDQPVRHHYILLYVFLGFVALLIITWSITTFGLGSIIFLFLGALFMLRLYNFIIKINLIIFYIFLDLVLIIFKQDRGKLMKNVELLQLMTNGWFGNKRGGGYIYGAAGAAMYGGYSGGGGSFGGFGGGSFGGGGAGGSW